ncbi:MAG: heme-binding protein, partial [Ignavibacteriae bacterium]|nr:heme-binding protein [Ignavibacteriota bacterium]
MKYFILLLRGSAFTGILLLSILGCEVEEEQNALLPVCSELLIASDVSKIISQAVEIANKFDQKVMVAVTDREGNRLGLFQMSGTTGDSAFAVSKARTAAYLSSNQHAFSSLTACFIVQNHFPPGIQNTPAGPLYGVAFSSLFGSDIQPNGSSIPSRPGLVCDPGGIPIYKNGCLVGGIGVDGGSSSFVSEICSGESMDEIIALGALSGYTVPQEKRGDNIFIDGIRFLYTNASPPNTTFTPGFDPLSLGSYLIGAQNAPTPKFPADADPMREVVLDPTHDFRIRPGTFLTAEEVRSILTQAAAQAARTRAAIRRPLGVASQVFIAVVDIDSGKVLGIWRTLDATIFSFDVSAQKARTALAFSNPDNIEFGQRIRSILGLSTSRPLAVTTRAVGFLSQDFFPPGIDRDSVGATVEPGPLYRGPNFAYQQEVGLRPYGNGITIFPGGIPLYKNGRLVGAIGISGDGVDQDDLIAAAGAT